MNDNKIVNQIKSLSEEVLIMAKIQNRQSKQILEITKQLTALQDLVMTMGKLLETMVIKG